MAYHKQIFPDKRTGRRGGLAKYNADLDAYVSDRIQSSQTEFYEQEAFEVNEISKDVYGGVLGTFINDKTQEIKGNMVLPLKPNVTQIPLIGEHISVIEFNGQHYYTDIINKLNSPNENALAGTSDYDELKKYGETFTRNNNVKHIDISEGDIVFNGRFNNSITLGSNGANKPITKIVVGHRVIENNLFKQTIDRDDASIYLVSDEASTTLDGQSVVGKKVLIKSDGIFISSNDIRLGTSVENDLQPIAKGNTVKEILDDIVDVLSQVLPIAIDNTQTPISTKNPALLTKINSLKTKTKNILSTKVKTQ
tara:strand:- start:169 stop:1095 length:927 start_codon:yes stop_codon:yes gene_type:complete